MDSLTVWVSRSSVKYCDDVKYETISQVVLTDPV